MTELAPRRTHATDAVEAELSAHRGAVLHREKYVSRALAVIMAACALLFTVAGVGAVATERAAPWPLLLVPFFVATLFALAGLTKPVLRTTVTEQEIYALHGLRESRVALSSITDVAVVEATRQALFGAEALGPAAGTHMILLSFTDAEARPRKCALPSRDPAALAAIIEEARAAASSTGVRAAPASGAGEPEHAAASTVAAAPAAREAKS